MAHDVGFINADNRSGDENFYFFGYRGGIFYDTFDAHHLDNGVSGANGMVLKDRATVLAGFERMSKLLKDDSQFCELYEKIKNCSYQNFLIWYS